MIPSFGNIQDFAFASPGFRGDVQVFMETGGGTVEFIHRWVKPRGVNMVGMLLVGSGGGGGGGCTGATTTARGGGGGGASGTIVYHIFPAYALPDELVIRLPIGGAGGAAGTIGDFGGNPVIAIGHGIGTGSQVPLRLAFSLGGTPGNPGTNAAAGTGGTALVAMTKANMAWAQAYSFTTITPGVAGNDGGAHTGAAGANHTAVWNTIPISGGAGGAGVNTVNTGFAGGAVSLQAAMDFGDVSYSPASSYLLGGSAGSGAAAGGNGNSGIVQPKGFLFTGGSGGGSADGQPGGNGGNGGPGCGGGGGGGGTTGGRGGNGGPAFVVIWAW